MILASQSPRRKELLDRTQLEFDVVPANIVEQAPQAHSPHELVQALAKQKALAVQQLYPQELILACDTLVFLNDTPLGKPKNISCAKEMLNKLSGNIHQVLSGVYLLYKDEFRSFYEKTEVEFYPLSKLDIDWYLQTDEPYDKAGAYGIQGFASLFVKSIYGSYDNVVGLPLARVYRELISFSNDCNISLSYKG